MAIKLSTALRNFMLGMGSFKEAFADSVINIYSGSAPATADLGYTGTLLLTVTKASGTVSSGELSTPQMAKITGSGTAGTYTVTINSVAYSQAYASSANATMANLVNVINRTCPEFTAAILTTTAIAYLAPRCQGNSGAKFTITGGTVDGGTITVDSDDSLTFAVSDALQFAAATAGTISKPTSGVAVWSGAGLTAAGTGTTAGYFRLCRSDDANAVDSTYIYERLQGSCAISGGDLNMSSTTIVSGATTTIDSFRFTLPESA